MRFWWGMSGIFPVFTMLYEKLEGYVAFGKMLTAVMATPLTVTVKQ